MVGRVHPCRYSRRLNLLSLLLKLVEDHKKKQILLFPWEPKTKLHICQKAVYYETTLNLHWNILSHLMSRCPTVTPVLSVKANMLYYRKERRTWIIDGEERRQSWRLWTFEHTLLVHTLSDYCLKSKANQCELNCFCPCRSLSEDISDKFYYLTTYFC